MEVNAPEKIYRTTFYLDNDKGDTKWKTNPFVGAENIEYTRTDIFIEKACTWLKESITNNPECNRIISKKGVITMGLLIKDFIQYMKGE